MYKLCSHSVYDEVQSYHHWVSNLLFLERHGPETLIVSIEVSPVYHRIHWINGIKVLVHKDVCLFFRRQYTYNLSKASTTRPIVGKGMFRAQAEERLWSPTRERYIRQQKR